LTDQLTSADDETTKGAGYIFEEKGKLLRPKFAMILARAIVGDDINPELEEKVKTWSAVIEMIHNSSLLQVLPDRN